MPVSWANARLAPNDGLLFDANGVTGVDWSTATFRCDLPGGSADPILVSKIVVEDAKWAIRGRGSIDCTEAAKLTAEAVSASEFHKTEDLPTNLQNDGALSAKVIMLPADFEGSLFSIYDANNNGIVDDGDIIMFPPQAHDGSGTVFLPIDRGGIYFVGLLAPGQTIDAGLIGQPLSAPLQQEDGTWDLGFGPVDLLLRGGDDPLLPVHYNVAFGPGPLDPLP